MDRIDQLEDRVEEHGEMLRRHNERLNKIEDTHTAMMSAISQLDTKHEQRLRDVKVDLQERITNMDTAAKERDGVNSQRLDNAVSTVTRVESKIDTAVQEVRDTPPSWVGPVIGILSGVLVCLIGGAIEYFIFKG